MRAEQLREIHRAKPFRPFTLRQGDGSQVRVPHPEFLWLLPGGRTAHVATGDDSFEIIDLVLVAAIEVGNGRARRGRKS